MRYLKQLVAFVIVALILIFGVLFAIQNTATVPLDLLFVQFSAQRVSIWMLLAFVSGGVMGLLVSSMVIIRLKSQALLLRRKLDKHEKELAKVRAIEL